MPKPHLTQVKTQRRTRTASQFTAIVVSDRRTRSLIAMSKSVA